MTLSLDAIEGFRLEHPFSGEAVEWLCMVLQARWELSLVIMTMICRRSQMSLRKQVPVFCEIGSAVASLVGKPNSGILMILTFNEWRV